MNVSSEASKLLLNKTKDLARSYGIPLEQIKGPVVEIVEVVGARLLGDSTERIPVTGGEMSRMIAGADLSQESINNAIRLIAERRARRHHHDGR